MFDSTSEELDASAENDITCREPFTLQKWTHSNKVQVARDFRGVMELMMVFRHISPDILRRIWEERQHSWEACFDVLSAWVASHGHFLTSDKQLEFVLELELWPALPSRRHASPSSSVAMMLTPQLSRLSLSRSSFGDCASGVSDGWSLCDDSDNGSDIGENWLQVEGGDQYNANLSEKTVLCDISVDSSPSIAKKEKMSFKDALLTVVPVLPSEKRGKRRRSDSTEEEVGIWKPTIVCVRLSLQQRRRCDVLYMDSDEIKSAPLWDDVPEDDEFEGHGGNMRHFGAPDNPRKSFAATAILHNMRVRGSVHRGNNQFVKELRCKY